ncbi:MAG: MFS transporter [Deltaproteobacteria bacterium]|nr:MFS transporter [Deltaproteobacteria bacterium]
MTRRRFAPFFWTQFFGAFNDNLFKNGLMILIAYGAGNLIAAKSDITVNLAAGLFILPFFLFSATAGQMADKYEKSMLIQRIKIAEIMIMGLGALAFSFSSLVALIFLLFLMGTQSAFFGPIKYSIIPDHLKPDEIVGGNALVEMGTFVAILLGLIAGNLLNPVELSPGWIAAAVCFVAVLGWWASRFIPKASPPAPDLVIDYNPLTQTIKTIGYARNIHSVFLSIIAISWFWFLGMAYLTQLPNYTKNVLFGTQDVYTLLLTVFSAGIGFGSMLCERLSGRKVELGLVPLGSLGISLFGIDLFFANPGTHYDTLMGITAFIHCPGSIRVLVDLLMIGIFGGIYIVPLFAFIQTRTEKKYRARVIAANNILNAFFMVVSALAGIVFLGFLNLTIPEFFLVLAIMNIAAAAYIYTVVPEFAMRFLIWVITHTMYRVRHVNLDAIPDAGPAVIVCNHVSYMDALILAGSCRRPIRFVMFEPIFRIPVLKFIFKTGKAIPIASKRENPATYHAAFESISEALEEDEIVCIFPEGKLTRDGEIDVFKPGIEKIIQKNPVPVIPVALRGMWGSFFSHKSGPALRRLPSRFWSKITIQAGSPVSPENVSANDLRKRVKDLRGEHR